MTMDLSDPQAGELERTMSDNPYWINRSVEVIIAPDSPMVKMLHDRCDASLAEFKRQMNEEMYGDREPPRVRTRWERISDRYWLYRGRISDAWDVLTGQAEIGDGW